MLDVELTATTTSPMTGYGRGHSFFLKMAMGAEFYEGLNFPSLGLKEEELLYNSSHVTFASNTFDNEVKDFT